MIAELSKILDRELLKLQTEIELFKNEENLWKVSGTVINSAGNLALHLVGNLNTYIGKNIGQTNYIRNREAEFNLKEVKRTELIREISETREIVRSSLEKIRDSSLDKLYPENVLGYEMTYGYFLVHLASHLSYHLGQINYIRRILD